MLIYIYRKDNTLSPEKRKNLHTAMTGSKNIGNRNTGHRAQALRLSTTDMPCIGDRGTVCSPQRHGTLQPTAHGKSKKGYFFRKLYTAVLQQSLYLCNIR